MGSWQQREWGERKYRLSYLLRDKCPGTLFCHVLERAREAPPRADLEGAEDYSTERHKRTESK